MAIDVRPFALGASAPAPPLDRAPPSRWRGERPFAPARGGLVVAQYTPQGPLLDRAAALWHSRVHQLVARAEGIDALSRTPAADLLSGPRRAVRRLLPADPGADPARGGAGLRVLLVHRAPLPPLRRSRAESRGHDGAGGGPHVAHPPGLGDLHPAAAPPPAGGGGLRDGGRGL